MKFQSNILSEARGKLNGMVFSRNRYASIIRNKTSPVNRDTTAQALQRSNFAALSAGFRALTPSQIAAWNAAAENWKRNNVFGQQYTQSGLNLYVGLNTNIVNVAGTIISEPPTPEDMPVLDATALTVTTTTMSLTLSVSSIPAGHSLIIQATQSVSAGRNFLKNLYRTISVQAAAASSPIDLFSTYSAKFGAPVKDMRVGVRAYLVNKTTGQAGLPFNISGIVGTAV